MSIDLSNAHLGPHQQRALAPRGPGEGLQEARELLLVLRAHLAEDRAESEGGGAKERKEPLPDKYVPGRQIP